MKKATLLLCFFSQAINLAFSQTSTGDTTYKFTEADTLRGNLSSLRSCYNVLSYDLDIKIDVEEKYISGANTIKFKAESDFQKIQIDLFENMVLQRIGFENVELKFIRQGNAVFITFPRMMKKGDINYIKIYYNGKPQTAANPPWDGGFSWNKDNDSNTWVGVSCQHLGASSWWPCKDHQSDEPDEMYMRVAVPSYLTAVCNGRLINVKDLYYGFTRYEWHLTYPINTYAVTVNIGKYKHFNTFYKNPNFADTLTLDFYVLPYNEEIAKEHFKQLKPMLDCYYKRFGEYPFVNDGYKLVETPYLGMEHQSCIAYGNKYKSGYMGKDLTGSGADFDYIIIHESAHEWWGNAITTNDIADMWVHEGFATYTEALFVECTKGYDAYLKYINGEKKNVHNNKNIIGNYFVNNMGSRDMYPKGALLLHTIRSLINNDSIFFSILQGLQNTYKYRTVNTYDIEKYISDNSCMDLSPLFDLYLRSTSIPKLQYHIEKTSTGIKVSYSYATNKPFTMPVKITLKKDSLDFIYPTEQWQTLQLDGIKPEEFKIATDLFYIDVEKK